MNFTDTAVQCTGPCHNCETKTGWKWLYNSILNGPLEEFTQALLGLKYTSLPDLYVFPMLGMSLQVD